MGGQVDSGRGSESVLLFVKVRVWRVCGFSDAFRLLQVGVWVDGNVR